MDAFFASAEQRERPELRGKPVAVGGHKRRGVIAAASYEARKYGVRSAMPAGLALKKCPDLIIVHGHGELYVEISKQINEIFWEYTDIIEKVSIDEAYLDVTVNKQGIPSATIIAKEIKKKIKGKTQLNSSAGVSFNKFLAKVASDYDKPDGLYVIPPQKAEEFIDNLPIGKIPGIGSVTEEKMHELGVKTGGDMKRLTKYQLESSFGKIGLYYYDLIRLNYRNPVTPDHIRKSIGAERTFEFDLNKIEDMLEALLEIARKISRRMVNKDVMGKTVTLKIKYHDFVMNTRSKTVKHLIQTETEIFETAKELLTVPIPPIKPVRLLGISVSNLNNQPDKAIAQQLTFDFYKIDNKNE